MDQQNLSLYEIAWRHAAHAEDTYQLRIAAANVLEALFSARLEIDSALGPDANQFLLSEIHRIDSDSKVLIARFSRELSD